MKAAVPNEIIEARYYRGGALLAGAATGFIGATIAANSYPYW